MSLKNMWGLIIVAMTVLVAAAVFAPINGSSGDGLFRFFGRFHILILHFPVVLLICAPIGDFLARRPEYAYLKNLASLLWIAGAISAVFTVLLGLMLASNEGLTQETVAVHKISGLSVALLALLILGLRNSESSLPQQWIKIGRGILSAVLVIMIFIAAHAGGNLVHGSSYLTTYAPSFIKAMLPAQETFNADFEITDTAFINDIQPLLAGYCYECHGPDKQKGSIRLDTLNPDMITGIDAAKWYHALNMINNAEMPPKEEKQLASNERRALVNWLQSNLDEATEAQKANTQVVMRRLTKQQYTNSLQDILGLDINFGETLPDDPKSELGFTNNGSALQASSLHLDYFQNIAREALAKAISPAEKPAVSHYKVTFGQGLGKGLVAGGKNLAYQEVPVHPDHFKVDLLDNDGKLVAVTTDAQKADMDAIRKKISVGMRGSSRSRFHMVKEGMILYSALPHQELPPQSWQGASPNLKLQMQRVFPQNGQFAMRVTASKGYFPEDAEPNFVGVKGLNPQVSLNNYDQQDAIVINAHDGNNRDNVMKDGDYIMPVTIAKAASITLNLPIKEKGFYQIDVIRKVATGDDVPAINVNIDDIGQFKRFNDDVDDKDDKRRVNAIGVAFMTAGDHELRLGGEFFSGFSHVIATPYAVAHPEIAILQAPSKEEQEIILKDNPSIRTYAGTFLDDGMDYLTFDQNQIVDAPLGQAKTYDFYGRLENLPIPEADTGDTEPLSGIMVLGLWNDQMVKNSSMTGPPLLVESIEFEAPFYAQWPLQSHNEIFIASDHERGSIEYTTEVVERFIEKAFRRPATRDELNRYIGFWDAIKGEFDRYEDGVKETLVAVLTSPNFLFLAEPTDGFNESYALASRLSYFLWDSPPDAELLELAKSNQLKGQLPDVIDRMLGDDKAWRFIRSFGRQWLSLDRAETIGMDMKKYPNFTRFVRDDLQEETYQFFGEILKNDLSIMEMIHSDFTMLNQNLAEYYGIDGI
ncbi:MAG: DUF1592 domain-containing protein, partial [Kordiimonadaceae bacterium]|nr:DUF1592 domain-containing protein [Kordiimonadaceae bacterium]